MARSCHSFDQERMTISGILAAWAKTSAQWHTKVTNDFTVRYSPGMFANVTEACEHLKLFARKLASRSACLVTSSMRQWRRRGSSPARLRVTTERRRWGGDRAIGYDRQPTPRPTSEGRHSSRALPPSRATGTEPSRAEPSRAEPSRASRAQPAPD